MEMRTIAIAMGVFLLVVGGFLTFVIIYGSDDGSSSSSAGTPDDPAEAANKLLEEQVLAGYEVKFWSEGRPFITYYDIGAADHVTGQITEVLFWQSQYAAGGDMGGMGAPPPQGFDGNEASYRLGLIYEHGLFQYDVNRREALRYYRIAKVGGHSGGAEGERRLTAAGVK